MWKRNIKQVDIRKGERERVINDLQAKIDGIDQENIDNLNEETKKGVEKILWLYIVSFLIYVAMILVEAIRNHIANKKIMYYEYCEMMLEEVKEEKNKKKKK